ncbi:MAG TPA: DUF4249 domain-containing protein [Chitinophagaceae bacterium]|nr:DUF4249 domain-containing protein [Chitinophagaceae bacterium]
MKPNAATYNHLLLVTLTLLAVVACRQRYQPPVASSSGGILVVDGFIVPGNDSTFILLSRTAGISDTIKPTPETGAEVKVTGEAGDEHKLFADTFAGRYISHGLNLNPAQKYRLVVVTADGRQYQSDLLTVKTCPAIDSLSWDRDSTGNAQVYVSSHDDNAQSIYYKWDYVETWVYHSSIETYFDWVDRHSVFLQPEDRFYYCWHSHNSTNVNISSTAKLGRDVVYRQPVITVKKGTEQISVKYSILVNQYVLTKEAYEFWDGLKKSNEQIGSLFDQQPTQLETNMHCTTDTSQKVVGYVSISERQTKRLFIKNIDLPGWDHVPYYTGFKCDTINANDVEMDKYFPPNGQHNYSYLGKSLGAENVIMKKDCVDCRVFGGTNKKPPFWQ